jgi:Arc/MetJ family transcription regulator
MKTTVEIQDGLLARARRHAAARGETLRAVLEAALRRLLEEDERPRAKPFRLRDKAYGGRGLRKGIAEGDWRAIRERAYEGRGG